MSKDILIYCDCPYPKKVNLDLFIYWHGKWLIKYIKAGCLSCEKCLSVYRLMNNIILYEENKCFKGFKRIKRDKDAKRII